MAIERDLGVEAKPVLAIVRADLTSHAIDGVPVVLLSGATELLLFEDGRRLRWEEAKRVFGALEALTPLEVEHEHVA